MDAQDMPTKKLLPWRNWCLVEECPGSPPSHEGADQASMPSLENSEHSQRK